MTSRFTAMSSTGTVGIVGQEPHSVTNHLVKKSNPPVGPLPATLGYERTQLFAFGFFFCFLHPVLQKLMLLLHHHEQEETGRGQCRGSRMGNRSRRGQISVQKFRAAGEPGRWGGRPSTGTCCVCSPQAAGMGGWKKEEKRGFETFMGVKGKQAWEGLGGAGFSLQTEEAGRSP